MVTAYILVEMSAGHSRVLVEKLEANDNVREVARVTGPYDVVVIISGEDLTSVSDTVMSAIHPMQGVLRTTTCVGIETRPTETS